MTTQDNPAAPTLTEPLTDDMIIELGREARAAGDREMASTCSLAIDGVAAAQAACAKAITDARAMDDETPFVRVIVPRWALVTDVTPNYGDVIRISTTTNPPAKAGPGNMWVTMLPGLDDDIEVGQRMRVTGR